MEKVLEVEKLKKSFSDNRVLNSISLEVKRGEFLIIMGSSGSGKSTLLYNISGLDSYDSGRVFLESIEVSANNQSLISGIRRNKAGFVFQDFNLIPNLNVLDNILVANFSLNKKKAKTKAASLLNKMGILDIQLRYPGEISGGEAQRVAIARALINSPSVLFADEPTGNLNSSSSQNILDILSKENESGQTIIMVTHELKAACRGSRILFLRDGAIEGEYINKRGSEEELYSWLKERGW